MNNINDQNWLGWCRLCAKMNDCNFVPVIDKGGETSDPLLLAAIGKHFWVNISVDDLLPHYLCLECHELINELQRFAQHVNKVQTMFYTLKTVDVNDVDMQIKIRHNHGITVDTSHILHKNCIGNQEKLNMETTKENNNNCEKENIVYEIIELKENETEKLEQTKANAYNIMRRKRKTPTITTTTTSPMPETVKIVNTNIFDEIEFCTNSGEEDEEKEVEDEEDRNINENSNKDVMEYECEICAKKYKMFMCYKKHMVEFHNKEPHMKDLKCDCGKTFSTKKQLQTHERSHIPLEQKLLIPCPYCNKKFTKANIMRQHMKGQHFNEKPYICDECGKALKTMAALKEHKLVHTNDCPFECDVCHKRFKNKARLKIHSDVHAQSYNCSVCGLLLNTRRTLRMHMLVHSEEKQFKCDFCSQAFKRGKALKNHLILHRGLRPYKCTFCDRAFANNSNCRSHKKKMHPQQLALEEAKGVKSKAVVPLLHELRNGCLNGNTITQKETENASKNLESFLVSIDDLPNTNLQEKNESTKSIVIEESHESDDDQNYTFSDEEYLITKAEGEEEEEEGAATIVYEVLNDLP